ncbi:MAG: L,D-transpeptidase/peptidoglycan binding protein [Actinomycetota bacterium]|nr:L,D-transpeptidase/peptidoglycan binding protein [Actinomycetota bacterium]
MHPAVADVLEPAASSPPVTDPVEPGDPPSCPPRRLLRRGALFAALVLVLVGGVVGAAYAYDRSSDDEFLPGVRVAGVDVGGRRPADVVRDVDSRLHAEGGRTVRVGAGAVKAAPSLDELGLRSDTAAVVARAEADGRSMGMVRRVWHRLLGKPVGRSYPVRFRLDAGRAGAVIDKLAKDVDRPPVDAKIDTSTGLVTIVPAVPGQAVDKKAGVERLMDVGERLANGRLVQEAGVDVPVAAQKPKVTGYADVILIRTNENRLYHYENGALSRTFTVATGVPEYPTPKGRFQITLKRRNPTWVNPDPGGWGASMPPSIPPGPTNPLGTRALNLSAPGIRIHGTSNVGSLGSAASHGCIRMSIPDSEYLFERVETGTPVIIIPGPGAPRVSKAAPSSPLAPVRAEGG